MPNAKLTRSAIRKIKEKVEDDLLALPGVQGVDINEKTVNGRGTGNLSIVVYVKNKKPKAKLSEAELIPNLINGIPTDVQEEEIELQPAFALLSEMKPQIDTTKYATLRGGISVGPCRSVYLEPPDVPSPGNYIFVGTLGAMVKDRNTSVVMALTNFHVACVDDSWSVGDTMAQPSLIDGGSCPSDRFGTLARATLSENVDGAVIAVNSTTTSDCSIEGIGSVKGTVTASIGTAVRKRGRTTELTYGTIDSTDASITINYGDGLGSRTLKKQIRVKPDISKNSRFSDHGDSGSVVVDGNNKVLGLLFGGTTSGSATYLNPIQKVLDELNVDLCVKPNIIVTLPNLCGPIITKPIVCTITKPVICQIVTKPVICQVVTAPKYCPVKTLATCPPKTLACPPVSLACGVDTQLPPVDTTRSDTGPTSAYGRYDAEGVDDAFWLGYYTALEAISEMQSEESGD